MAITPRLQILDEAFDISVNALGNGMNPIILPPAIAK